MYNHLFQAEEEHDEDVSGVRCGAGCGRGQRGHTEPGGLSLSGLSGDLHRTRHTSLHTHLLQGNKHTPDRRHTHTHLTGVNRHLCVLRAASWSRWTSPRSAARSAGSGSPPGPDSTARGTRWWTSSSGPGSRPLSLSSVSAG